jgi:hypothetical protein
MLVRGMQGCASRDEHPGMPMHVHTPGLHMHGHTERQTHVPVPTCAFLERRCARHARVNGAGDTDARARVLLLIRPCPHPSCMSYTSGSVDIPLPPIQRVCPAPCHLLLSCIASSSPAFAPLVSSFSASALPAQQYTSDDTGLLQSPSRSAFGLKVSRARARSPQAEYSLQALKRTSHKSDMSRDRNNRSKACAAERLLPFTLLPSTPALLSRPYSTPFQGLS